LSIFVTFLKGCLFCSLVGPLRALPQRLIERAFEAE
jgi:hypothetical protein